MRRKHGTAMLSLMKAIEQTTGQAMDPEMDQPMDHETRPLSSCRRALLGRRMKPKTPPSGRPLRNITSSVRQERLAYVRSCVGLGMAVPQIADYLTTLGVPLSERKV